MDVFNHTQHFQYDDKSYTRKNYTYSIEELREIVSTILKNVKYLTILRYYNRYIRKIDWYKKEIEYRFVQ